MFMKLNIFYAEQILGVVQNYLLSFKSARKKGKLLC